MGNSSSVQVGERKLKVLGLLAEGGFSLIYRVRHEPSKKEKKEGKRSTVYALKRMHCGNQDQIDAANWEIDVHRKCDHPNVMRLVDAALVPAQRLDAKAPPPPADARDALLLLAFFPLGSMQGVLEGADAAGRAPFSEAECLRILFELGLGLQALHRMGMAHRDLKPANVLMAGASSGDPATPVLTDLGSCSPALVPVRTRREALTLQDSAAVMSSASYRAPELHDVLAVGATEAGLGPGAGSATIDTRQSDVFSLGACLWAMAFGMYGPFESPIEGVQVLKIVNGGVTFPAEPLHEGSDAAVAAAAERRRQAAGAGAAGAAAAAAAACEGAGAAGGGGAAGGAGVGGERVGGGAGGGGEGGEPAYARTGGGPSAMVTAAPSGGGVLLAAAGSAVAAVEEPSAVAAGAVGGGGDGGDGGGGGGGGGGDGGAAASSSVAAKVAAAEAEAKAAAAAAAAARAAADGEDATHKVAFWRLRSTGEVYSPEFLALVRWLLRVDWRRRPKLPEVLETVMLLHGVASHKARPPPDDVWPWNRPEPEPEQAAPVLTETTALTTSGSLGNFADFGAFGEQEAGAGAADAAAAVTAAAEGEGECLGEAETVEDEEEKVPSEEEQEQIEVVKGGGEEESQSKRASVSAPAPLLPPPPARGVLQKQDSMDFGDFQVADDDFQSAAEPDADTGNGTAAVAEQEQERQAQQETQESESDDAEEAEEPHVRTPPEKRRSRSSSMDPAAAMERARQLSAVRRMSENMDAPEEEDKHQ